ncbi:hypothetical protein PMAYCL1PPCAC_07807, partial [Pristionchus mayeri]
RVLSSKATNEVPEANRSRKIMKSSHRRGLLKLSLVFISFFSLIPRTEGFFFNLPGMNSCGGCPSVPLCCLPHHHHHHHHQQQPSSG